VGGEGEMAVKRGGLRKFRVQQKEKAAMTRTNDPKATWDESGSEEPVDATKARVDSPWPPMQCT
jgi:hypothetical protein